MAKRIVDNEEEVRMGYPINPMDIDTRSHFWDAFGNNETEVSANIIVRLCQKTGGWYPFTCEEVEAHLGGSFFFHKLCNSNDHTDKNNFVILGEDERYRVTHEFIASCFKSSPWFPMA